MKKPKVTNYRIEVLVPEPLFGWKDHRSRVEALTDVARLIRRRVDEVEAAQVFWDDEWVCEFCGDRWTEDSDTYNGGCCDSDQTAEDSRQSEVKG